MHILYNMNIILIILIIFIPLQDRSGAAFGCVRQGSSKRSAALTDIYIYIYTYVYIYI